MITAVLPILAIRGSSFEFLTGASTGTLRNDFGGFVGGSVHPNRNMTVTHLGRYVNSGNTGSHLVTLWNSTTSTLVAQTVIDCAGAAVAYKYNTLPTFAPLASGQSYVLTSQESAGGDTWRNFNSIVPLSQDFGSPSSCFSASPTGGHTFDVANAIYVPVNLKYY